MADTTLKITDLASSYGNIKALKQISLEINKGEIVSLLGANGAGKKSHEIVPMGIFLVPEGRKIFVELSVEKNLEIGTFFRKRKKIQR